jgi:hypothetical protein
MLVPDSSALVRAFTAESRTLGTVSSSASVVLERGIRCWFAALIGLRLLVADRDGYAGFDCTPVTGTPRDGWPTGSMSRSKIAELEECLSNRKWKSAMSNGRRDMAGAESVRDQKATWKEVGE